MYVANSFVDGTVFVIDTNTNTVTGVPIPVGDFPVGIAYDSANERMYVANRGDGTVSVIDTNTNTVIDTIPVGSVPQFLAYDPINKESMLLIL